MALRQDVSIKSQGMVSSRSKGGKKSELIVNLLNCYMICMHTTPPHLCRITVAEETHDYRAVFVG